MNAATAAVAEEEAAELMEREYAALLIALRERGWDLDTIVLAPHAVRAVW
jgi:hypothetical protein